MKRHNRYRYRGSCVDWPKGDFDGLLQVIENKREVSRRTFLAHVDRSDLKELEASLGYTSHHTQGLIMSQDWGVTYHRSKRYDIRVYVITHSSIEYIFI